MLGLLFNVGVTMLGLLFNVHVFILSAPNKPGKRNEISEYHQWKNQIFAIPSDIFTDNLFIESDAYSLSSHPPHDSWK
jgi:hypothetical protein